MFRLVVTKFYNFPFDVPIRVISREKLRLWARLLRYEIDILLGMDRNGVIPTVKASIIPSPTCSVTTSSRNTASPRPAMYSSAGHISFFASSESLDLTLFAKGTPGPPRRSSPGPSSHDRNVDEAGTHLRGTYTTPNRLVQTTRLGGMIDTTNLHADPVLHVL